MPRPGPLILENIGSPRPTLFRFHAFAKSAKNGAGRRTPSTYAASFPLLNFDDSSVISAPRRGEIGNPRTSFSKARKSDSTLDVILTKLFGDFRFFIDRRNDLRLYCEWTSAGSGVGGRAVGAAKAPAAGTTGAHKALEAACSLWKRVQIVATGHAVFCPEDGGRIWRVSDQPSLVNVALEVCLKSCNQQMAISNWFLFSAI